jgi:hypothetical protein
MFTSEGAAPRLSANPFYITIAVKNYQTKSGCEIITKVCPEISNHVPVENFKSGFDLFFFRQALM